MAAAGGAATGRIDADGREWDTRQRECQRSMCKLMAHPCGKAELAKSGSGWVVRNDVEVAALVTVRHVFKHVMEAGRLTGRVTATWADGQKLSLAGASVLSAPEPGATADPPPDMDALVVRLAPGKLFPAPPVPCAVATVDADGSVADADHVLVQPGAACTLLHYPRGEGWQGDGSVVVNAGGKVGTVIEGGGQPWCLTHNLASDEGSSGGMLIDAQCRAIGIHRGRQASDVKVAVLLNALHVGLGQASPWLGATPVEHGRVVEFGLPPQCGNFVGRVHQLAALTRVVKDKGKVKVVSTGLPGVGKSAMVCEWAHRASLSRLYGVILWLRADTAENLYDDLVGLSEQLRMPLPAVRNPSMKERAAHVKQQLQSGVFVSGVALLVFDNVDDYGIVRDFVPAGRHCRVVFTARDRLTYAGLHVLPLEPFAMHESMKLLRAIIARPIEGHETAAAMALCEEVGHLPLAVEQLAWYAKESGAFLASVLRNVQQSAASAGPLDNIIVADYARRASVIGALLLVQRQLSEAGRRALQCLALLAPERVPRELLGPDADNAISELSSLAIVSFPEPGLVSAHRLVLRVAREQMPNGTDDRLRTTKEVVAALAMHVEDFDHADAATWSSIRVILPHVEAFSALKADTSLWHDATVVKDWLSVLSQLFWYTKESIRDYAASLRWAKQAKADACAACSEESDVSIVCSVQVAWALSLFGESSDSVSMCLSLLRRVATRLTHVDDSSASDLYNLLWAAYDLASVLMDEEKYQDALALVEQLLARLEVQRDDVNDLLLEVRLLKARVLGAQGNLEQAVMQIKEFLPVAKSLSKHILCLKISHHLAYLYKEQGKLDKALELLRPVRDGKAACWGEECFLVASIEFAIGDVLQRQGKLKEAEEVLKESLRKQVAQLKEDHEEVCFTRETLEHVQEKLAEQSKTAQAAHSTTGADIGVYCTAKGSRKRPRSRSRSR